MATHAPRRVLVTRDEEEDGRLSGLLEAAGLHPVLCPAVAAQPVLSAKACQVAMEALDRTRWLVITSPRTVEMLETFAVLETPPPATLRIAAAGPRTAQVLRAHGWSADVVPDDAGGAPLADAILDADAGERGPVLVPGSLQARPELPRKLRAAGYDVDTLALYDMVPAPQDPDWWSLQLTEHPPRAITFTSPSAVEGLVAGLEGTGLLEHIASLPAAVQGPTTGQATRAAGWTTVQEADPRTFEGLVAAVLALLAATELRPAPAAPEQDPTA